MSEEKNTVTENKMEDKNMTFSETAKQDTEEPVKKEAEKNEIMTSPEKAEETVKDEPEEKEPKEKDELLLSEESEEITNEESTPQNLPVKIKPEDLSVEPILSSDSDEVFMKKFKYGIQVGFRKMKCAFEGCVIIGALFNQLDERRELRNKPLRSPYLQGFHRFYNDYSDYLSNQSLVYNIQLLITGNLS